MSARILYLVSTVILRCSDCMFKRISSNIAQIAKNKVEYTFKFAFGLWLCLFLLSFIITGWGRTITPISIEPRPFERHVSPPKLENNHVSFHKENKQLSSDDAGFDPRTWTPFLQKSISELFNKPINEVSRKNLAKVSDLYLYGDGCRFNIEDLKFFANLETLHLINFRIDTLGWEFPQSLRELDVSYSYIVRTSEKTTSKSLKVLDVSYTNLDDLGSFLEIVSLETLIAEGVLPSLDYSVLKEMPSLRSLFLSPDSERKGIGFLSQEFLRADPITKMILLSERHNIEINESFVYDH